MGIMRPDACLLVRLSQETQAEKAIQRTPPAASVATTGALDHAYCLPPLSIAKTIRIEAARSNAAPGKSIVAHLLHRDGFSSSWGASARLLKLSGSARRLFSASPSGLESGEADDRSLSSRAGRAELLGEYRDDGGSSSLSALGASGSMLVGFEMVGLVLVVVLGT